MASTGKGRTEEQIITNLKEAEGAPTVAEVLRCDRGDAARVLPLED